MWGILSGRTWFIDIVSPNNDMKGHLQKLLADFPMIDIKAMGFQRTGKKNHCGKNSLIN